MHRNIGFNSFEDLLCAQNPEIKDLLQTLRKYDNGSVSGSGGCLFSMFDDEVSAQNISKLIPKKYQTNPKNQKKYAKKRLYICL